MTVPTFKLDREGIAILVAGFIGTFVHTGAAVSDIRGALIDIVSRDAFWSELEVVAVNHRAKVAEPLTRARLDEMVKRSLRGAKA